MSKITKSKKHRAIRDNQAHLLVDPLNYISTKNSESQTQDSSLRTQDFFLRWLSVVLYMVLIFLLSDQSKDGGVIPDFGNLDLPVKKLGHFLEYAVLALLFLRALHGTQSPTRQHLTWAFALTVLYAMTDEYHQTLVPGRAGRWEDVVIDASGALLALLLWWRKSCPEKKDRK